MILWVEPGLCDPPHKVSRENQVRKLSEQFSKNGWDADKPALIGYPLNHRIQLLSGSHRWAAAVDVLDRIPVIIKDYDEVENARGDLILWKKLMKAEKAGYNKGVSSKFSKQYRIVSETMVHQIAQNKQFKSIKNPYERTRLQEYPISEDLMDIIENIRDE
jgi:hypothetical protein